MEQNRKTGTFEQFCDFMQRDTKGVEFIAYSLSGVLFVVAYTKMRPFTRFGRAADIPRHFVRNQVRQYGRVEKIEPSLQFGPLLMVKHRPPLNLMPWSRTTLPVKVNGLDVNANGYSWLQSVIVNREVSFLPIVTATGQRHAECRVFLNERNRQQIDVGEALLSLGFAKLTVTVPKEIKTKDPTEKQLQLYYHTLARSERYARDHRNGLWLQALPPRIWPVSQWQKMWDKLWFSKRLPSLVR